MAADACPHEERVVRAATDPVADPALEEHVLGCRSCRELRRVAGWVRERAPLQPPPFDSARAERLWRVAHPSTGVEARALVRAESKALALARGIVLGSVGLGACWLGRAELASALHGATGAATELDSAAARLALEAGRQAPFLVLALLAATAACFRRGLAR